MCFFSFTAFADGSSILNGTWIIDAKATEDSIIRTRPFKDKNSAYSFLHHISYLGALVFDFEGEKLFGGTFPGNERKREFILVSHKDAENEYNSIPPKDGTKAQEKPETLVVTVLNQKNITISFSGSTETQYLLWKHVTLDPNKKTPNDYKPEFDAFIGMMMNIGKTYDSQN